ncbi:hypothetical protein MKY29_18510 [Psychrobacillus sp. FSL K6-2365]|uniref:hypothetical protein n=1 Tax=Psychrobacillus sp. FSL K6-2365 TaxID=2921546 RepID=UPI0030F5FBEF
MSEKTFHETTSSNGTFIGAGGNEAFTFPTLRKIFNLLETRGWFIQTDQRILKDYAILAKDHWEGKKGDLQFKAKRYPSGIELEFFQEVNTKNSNGGKYDFDKLKMMPYLIRCQFLVELKHIKNLLLEEGFEDTTKPNYKYAIDKVMFRIKDCWHYEEGKELPEYEISSYNSKDKDGKQLRNGDIKYFRDHKGRLRRGTIYHNINNMWWVVLNKFEFTNEASFYFFDLDSEENRVRKLVKKSGYHKPLARLIFDADKTKQVQRKAKEIGKQGRLDKANEMLKYLFKIGWTSRWFSFELKSNGRLGLLEIESKAWGVHRVHEKPAKLSLYGRTLPMSSTESYWVKSLREYVVHSKRSITDWFCEDRNGQGSDAHYWPEVRKLAWEIGVLAS